MPTRQPDSVRQYSTRTNLALLYWLTGDRNPVHADPAVARAAGFERPILHGLCSFGITCRAVLETYADLGPARTASHQERFTAPVFRGYTLQVEMWEKAGAIVFRAVVSQRQAVVVSNGRCVLKSPA